MTSDLDYTVYKDPWYRYKIGLCFTGRVKDGKAQVAYYLDSPEGERIFEGSDLYPGAGMCADGPETAAALLGFLTCQPGDTDDEYFDTYTPRQLEWCQTMEAEELASWAMEVEENGGKWAPEEED